MPTSHRQRLVAAVGAVTAAVGFSLAGLQTDAGFTQRILNTGSSASSTNRLGTCSDAQLRDAAYWAFLLRDPSTTTNAPAANLAPTGGPGSYQNSGTVVLNPSDVTHQSGQSGCTRDLSGYVSVIGGADGNTGNAGWVNGPSAGLPANSLAAGWTGEVWFRTSTTLGGSILAMGDTNFVANIAGLPITLSGRKDHQIFMFAGGRLCFAMYKGGTNLQITTTAAYNDNLWHHVVATVSPTTGSTLYVDGGAFTGTSTAATSGDIDGIVSYLHVGYESLVGWTGAPTRYAWTGDLAHAAIYTYPLTAQQELTHYRAGLA